MRPAEALRIASIMISSSIRLSLTGLQVDWTIKTSLPRTGSYTEMEHSPSANCETQALPTLRLSSLQMLLARAGLELPVKTAISLP